MKLLNKVNRPAYFRGKIFLVMLQVTLLLQVISTDLKAQDLNLQITSVPTTAKVGSTIAVQALVSEISGTAIPSGEPIILTISLIDPFGAVATKSDGTPVRHVETFSGFPANNSVFGNNDAPPSGQVLLQIPWNEASKWDAGNDNIPNTPDDTQWTIEATISGSTLETNLLNNTTSSPLRLQIPNLTISDVQRDGSLQPGTDLSISATIRNISDVRTQEGIFFGVTAGLVYADPSQTINLSLENAPEVIDFEMVILPKIKNPNDLLDSNNEAGFAYIDANDEVTVIFPPLRIPSDADGSMALLLSVDGSRPDVIHETIDRYDDINLDDNFHIEFFNVDTPDVELVVDADSFEGDIGLLNGLDPARIAFSVRNDSLRPLRSGDNFVIRTILSEDDVYDPSSGAGDMILREFDIDGENGLGAGLLPNENISFDWIQQLPDNFEGDYYLLVDINSSSGRTTFPLENTPVITLRSKNNTRVSLLNPENNGNVAGNFPTERPTASSDGRFVTYEQIDADGVQQIWYRDIVQNNPPVLVSRSLLSTNNVFGGNRHSLRPQMSADGSVIVFHSFANDLVPDDQNEHADVFLFRTINNQLIRAYNVPAREEGNGPSFYPKVNGDGTKVVFHSKATNLAANGSQTSSQQIYLWDTNIGTFGEIRIVTFGNNESHFPSIDHSGTRVVFSSDASDLVTGDTNGFPDIFAHDLDSNQTWLLSLTELLEQTTGPSEHPVISGDGRVVAFVSSASNLVRARGVSNIVVENGGVGYFGNLELIVSDNDDQGSGAVLSFVNGGIDQYGQILPNGIRILNSGKDYIDPQVTVLTDPNYPPPSQEADIHLNLTHPLGEIFKVDFDNPGGSLERVSQSFEGVGGNMRSREPSINFDGSLIVYSTKSSNLLDSNVTLPNGKVYYNQPANLAKARAILVGPIGEIEVQDPGSGYSNGFLSIDDLSGSGSGAIAEYEVDAIGRISSINIINQGENYNLDQTRISVKEPRNGSGFEAGILRFPQIQGFAEDRTGGGKVYRVEMLEHGMGYKGVEDSVKGLQTLIQIQGDGVDTDSNGMPDAKIDPSVIRIDSLGGVYLEQEFEMKLLSATSLLGTNLTVADDNLTIVIDFAPTNNSSVSNTVTIGTVVDPRPLEDIRDDIVDIIAREWSMPKNNTDTMVGPVITPLFGGDLTFRAISGRFETDNPTSVRIIEKSNMLFSGDGYTRATPTIGPLPVIHGFSEVLSGTFTDQTASGALILDVFEDTTSDDVYLYNDETKKSERISRSHYGQPVNFLPETGLSSMPSNRFPFISGNGRHVFFSSDSNLSGGLAFGVSNNQFLDSNGIRDVYYVDRKQTELSNIEIEIDMLYPNDLATFTFGTNSKIPVIAQIDYDDDDIHNVFLLVNNRPHGGDYQFAALTHFQNEFSTNRWSGTFNTGLPGEHVFQVIAVNDANVTLGASLPRTITVSKFDSLPPTVQLQNPGFDSLTTTSSTRLSATGNDRDGTLVGVQFYVDGQPLGSEIFRRQGVPQDFATFPVPLDRPNAGIRSIFAVARDNSGNYVSTDVFNISVTPGSATPLISIAAGPRSYKLTTANGDFDVSLAGNGAIEKIDLKKAAGGGFLAAPRIEISSDGQDAEFEVIVNRDTTSSEYGMVTSINVTNDGGSGYDDNFSISLLPVIRNIGYGEPAQLTTDRLPFTDQFGTILFYDYRFGLVLDVNGNPRNGYGYTVSPRLEFETRDGDFMPYIEPNGLNTSRLPLIDNNQTTSSVSNVLNDGTFFPIAIPFRSFPFYDLLLSRVRLVGGFTQAPMNFEFSVQPTAEPIRVVRFFVNGKNEDNKTSPPYSFIYTADEPGDYDVYAMAIDMTGNTVISDTTTFSTTRFEGSGVSVTLGTEDEFTLAAGSQTVVSAMASSDAGIAEVEFFVDGSSQGIVKGDGHAEAFVKELDMRGITQGEHELSVIARDFLGNEAGTFQDTMTNIDIRQNSKIIISPKLLSSQPPEVNFVYPGNEKMVTSTSTIYLSAESFDPDGRIMGVQFYVNGHKYKDEILFEPNFTQYGYPYGIAWSPNDPHNDPNYPYADDPNKVDTNYTGPGVYVITAVARDSSGNKSLSGTSTVTSTTGSTTVPSINFTGLNSFYEASQSIFLSAQISDEANSSNGTGVVEEVQFFANGQVIRDFNRTGPFFHVWDPPSGIYEVYAMAVDNEGNHAISDINTVFVGVSDDFDEQPQLGSINPTLDAAPLRISLSRRSGRRTAEGVVSITSIAGLPQSTLENLVVDQVIRFTNGTQTSSEYTVALITEDGALEVNGDVSADDEAILLGATQLEMIPIFTAGSSIYLSLKPEVDDSNFDSVTFYVDGTLWSTDNSWPFSTVFSPTEEGNYTISIVAENQFQNQTLYSERLFVEPSRGLVPSGAAEIMPMVTTRNNPTAFAVTLGSQLTLLAAYDDLDDGLSRVEFYLNGKLVKVDHQAPYYHTFTPTTESNALIEGGYEMAIVGIDYSGNRFSDIFQGVIGGSTVLPSTIVKAPNNMEEFSEGQSVEFKVEVVGSLTPFLLGFSSDPTINQNPNFTRIPRRMAIMANGEFVSVATETGWGTGVFVGDLIIDLNQAGPDGIVELFGTMIAEDYTITNAFGGVALFSPTIFSNTVKIKVTEPNLASDPQSAVNQTFNDLLGFNPSQAEVTNALTEQIDTGGYLFENQSFLNWAAKVSNRDSFQNMVDSIGGYHIMTGQWPLTTKVEEILNTYSATPNNNADGSGDTDGDGYSLLQEIRFQTDDQDPTSFPPPAFRIESFVDETLASNDFTDLHGRVPMLTPPPGIDAVGTTNYDKNRRDFVKIIFSNKYGYPPTPAQELQASFRIASLDPNSPEALYAQQLAIFEQLAMYASFGYGVTQGGGNNNAIVLPTVQPIPINQYLNAGGLPATLFVTNMIAEQLIDNQPMILGAPEKRSYYETAALIVALWADNLESLTDKLITEFHSLSKEDKIAKLMKDPRYFNRFGGYSISRMADELPASPGWKWLEWLGYFNDDGFPWIYHDVLGWVYVDGTSDDQVWLYLPNAGWLGTTKEIWEGMDGESNYLWLYDNQAAKWVAFYLHKTSKATFWDPVTQKYFSYE